MFLITPGANWAYAITAGLRYRTVLPAVGGLLAGHLLAATVVAAGVAALLAGSPLVMTVLTVASAAYLVRVGHRHARAAGDSAGAPKHPETSGGLGVDSPGPPLLAAVEERSRASRMPGRAPDRRWAETSL